MKNKKLLSFVILAVVALLAVFVYALGNTEIIGSNIKFGVGLTPSASNLTANISGTTNLTVALNTNASFFVNATIEWVFSLYPNGSNPVENNSVMATTTIQNTSRNSTIFHNATFATTTLPDGYYNVTVSVFNQTNSNVASPPLQRTINGSSFASGGGGIMNITVDNTRPNTTWLRLTEGTSEPVVNYTRYNITLAGITGFDTANFSVVTREELSGVKTVDFEFFNKRNGTRFNVSGFKAGVDSANTNRSGEYNASINISSLGGGLWTVTVFTTDQSNNLNVTRPVLFSVNDRINVSSLQINSSYKRDYIFNTSTFNSTKGDRDYNTTNNTFVVNIGNVSPTGAGAGGSGLHRISTVMLVFDNNTIGSVGGLNVTMNPVPGSLTEGSINFTASVSFADFVEGAHQVKVFVNDTFGNFNYTENISFIIDRTNPTVTVSCTPSEAKVGETVSCTCTASDNLARLNSTAKFAGGGNSESTTASSVGSFTSSVCSVLDNAGNKGSKTATFTVVEDTEEGGSGAGGSGGGSSSGSSGSYGQRSWTSLNSGEVAVVDVTDKSVGVTKVSFGVTATSYGGWVRVSKRDSAPLAAEAFGKKMYKVVEVTTAATLKETDLNNRKIEFRVEKSWLQTNSLAAADVTLYRLVNNEWVALAVTVGQDDGTYVHYSATTPGFSFFLIGEKGQGAAAPGEAGAAEGTPGAAPSEEGAPTEGQAMAKEGVSTATIVVIILIVLAAAGAVWYFFGRNKKE